MTMTDRKKCLRSCQFVGGPGGANRRVCSEPVFTSRLVCELYDVIQCSSILWLAIRTLLNRAIDVRFVLEFVLKGK